MAIEIFGEGSDWERQGKKEGGARGVGDDGGVYKNKATKVTALIKKDDKIEFNIAEFLGSQLFAATEPGSGATVQLMVTGTNSSKIPGDGSNVYVRSEFFENYTDMFKDMDRNISEEDRPNQHFRKDGRPLAMGTRELFSKTLSKAFSKQGYQDFDKIAPTSLLMGDFDVHIGNIGVIRKGTEKPRLVRIDYGWAFSNLTKDVHPHSTSKHLPGMGPTNHFREFPIGLKLTPEFVAGLDRAANVDMEKVLDKSFADLEKCYNQEALAKWAKHAMPNIYKDKDIKDIKVDDVKKNLKEVMVNRQKSLKEFSLEIKLGLLIEKGPKGQYQIKNPEELKQLVKDNPQYFEDIASGKKKVRFRDHKLGDKAKTLIKKEIIQIKEVLKVELAEESRAKVVPKKVPPPVPLGKKPLTTIVEPRAQDRIMLPVSKGVGKVMTGSSAHRVPSGGGADPITQAIRDEVLTKQQLYLQQEIAKTIPVGERNRFLDQDLSAFRTFLQTDNGKEKLSSAMQKPETENQLKNIESNGYKEVHTQFQDSFKNVAWVSPPNSKVRLSEIKGDDGQHITSLKETTVQGTTQVALEDGSMRSIKSYRQIEFPKQIEGGKGPAHFSMAVKDENGRNVPEKGAVYFTAHYDDKGKLTEVSSPVPVKFMGKGDDAIGYIERGGKVYTLPVTQGKYKEMMLEVVANKGMGANVSQSVEAEAQDRVTAVKVTPKVAALASDIGNTYKKKMTEHQPKPPSTKPRSNGRGGESMVI